MKIIYFFFKNDPIKFILASVSGILSGGSLAGVIYVINEAIQSEMADANWVIVKFLSLLILYVASSILSSYMITLLSQSAVRDMRVTLSKNILHESFHKLENETKRLFTILTDDISNISTMVNRMPTIITGFATVFGCFAYMIFISWKLFAIFFFVFIVAFLVYRLPLNAYNERLRIIRDYQNVLFGYFEGLIYGLKELSLNRKFRKVYTDEIILPVCEEQKKQNVTGQTVVEAFSRWGEMILLLGIGAILWTIKETQFVDYQILIQFLTVTIFTISPLSKITGYLPQMRRIDVALEQIKKAGLDIEKAAEDVETHHFDTSNKSELISIKDVTYQYYHSDEEKFFQLGPINLTIEKGEVLFLIGGNGSGKSTLAKIICGLYLPEKGDVLYKNIKVNQDNIKEYRDEFNAIFADFYLFEYINHLDPGKVEREVGKYLKLLELDKKVSIKGNKLSTTQLSTGQRKRLALLISYLEDKPIYLFDEWAAGLDPYYKKVFYTQLIPDLKKRGKTIIVITHDETYFDQADRVVMLKDGKILDSHLLHDQLNDFFFKR